MKDFITSHPASFTYLLVVTTAILGLQIFELL